MIHSSDLLCSSPDPQQRLLLEAFARLRCQDLQTTASVSPSMGVYVGCSQLEYARLTLEQNVPVNAYYATGENVYKTVSLF